MHQPFIKMKRFIAVILPAVAALTLACKSSDGGSGSGGSGFMRSSDCVAMCDLQNLCGYYENAPEEREMCRDICPVSTALAKCEYDIYSDTCKRAYRDFYECAVGIDNCEDLEAYMDGIIAEMDFGETEVTGYPCESPAERFMGPCSYEISEAALKITCGDELQAFEDLLEDLYADTDIVWDTDSGWDSDSARDTDS